MAVSITNDSDRSRHIGYLHIDSGKVVDLNTDSTGDFAAAAQNGAPVYDPASGDIWYLDGNDCSGAVLQRGCAVKAIDPDGGASTTGRSWGGDKFIIEGTSGNLTGPTSSNELPLPNPSGTAEAEYDSTVRPALTLRTASEGKQLVSIAGLDGLPSTEGRGLPARGTVPLVWVDDSTLITATDISTTSNTTASAMQLFRFSRNLRSVLGTSPLIPNSDRSNLSPVVSPDHGSVIFISGRGGTSGLYKVPIGSGAVQPTRLADTPVPAKLLEWR